jgi:hypothetical protein
LLEKLASPSPDRAKQANVIRDLEQLLEHSVSRIRGDAPRHIAAMKREVIRYCLHTTRDDRSYIVPGEINTNLCVESAHWELEWARGR